jgi:hypothetical protein
MQQDRKKMWILGAVVIRMREHAEQKKMVNPGSTQRPVEHNSRLVAKAEACQCGNNPAETSNSKMANPQARSHAMSSPSSAHDLNILGPAIRLALGPAWQASNGLYSNTSSDSNISMLGANTACTIMQCCQPHVSHSMARHQNSRRQLVLQAQ